MSSAKECHRCHLAKGEAFKARSENREPPTKSTRSRPKWQRWRRSWNDTDKQRESLNPHRKRQTCRQGQRTKWRSSTLDSCRQLGCSPTTTQRCRWSRPDWTKQGRLVTNPCLSARGFEQARTRSPCTRGISKRPTIECSRLNRAFWPLSKLWSSTEPRLWRSRGRCKSDGTIWSSSTDKLQLKPRTDPRPLSCKSSSQMESTNTCPGGKGQPQESCRSL